MDVSQNPNPPTAGEPSAIDKLKAAREALRRVRASASLYEFFKQAWHVINPYPFVDTWAVGAICEHLQAVTNGDIKNLLIACPPRLLKSSVSAIAWPAWEWIESPRTSWLYSAYSLSLSLRDAGACRRLIKSDWYRERWGASYRIVDDQDEKDRYVNDRGGYRITVSAKAGTTGEGGQRLVLDDPHDVLKAENKIDREETIAWYDTSFYNRVNDPVNSSRVVLGQRVHVHDLLGHLIESGQYEVLLLPEEYDSRRARATSIGWRDPRTQDGELLRPERMPAAVVEATKQVQRYVYQAQYLQDPIMREGALFKSEWLRYFRMVDGIYILGTPGGEAKRYPATECWEFLVCDPAASTKTLANADPDYTVIGAFAVTKDYNLLWLDCARLRLEVPDIVPKIQQIWNKHKPQFVAIESGGPQKGVSQFARRTPMAVKEISPGNVDLVVRSTPAQVMMESGRVFFAEGAAWRGVVEAELLSFTGDARKDHHDDTVSVLAMAAKLIDRKSMSMGRPPQIISAGIGTPYYGGLVAGDSVLDTYHSKGKIWRR